MITAPKRIANLGQTMLCQLLCQRHRNLPGPGHRSVAPFGHKVSHFNLVVFRDFALDVIQRDLLVLQRKQVLQAVLYQVDIERSACKVSAGDNPFQRPSSSRTLDRIRCAMKNAASCSSEM